MATVHITFRAPTQVGGTSILSRSPRVAETLTSSGTSGATTISAHQGEIADIVASGGAVYVAIGANPTAVVGEGDLVPNGGRIQIGFMNTTDKVATIDA